ncbi:MgtC family [Cupriavidus basilensis]|uniref:MgtC family n=1 Tax=Cupriavidus basilensis TaxID=68895 RepID=A0A0C4YAQ5_9BURK|nr:MgtC family [Cupriavidus basilensis]
MAFSVALGIGLAIGLERERSQAADGGEAPAGLRTFAIASVSGALGAFLPNAGLLPAVLLAIAGLAALGYRHTAAGDPGMTTEIALLCTVLLGALAVTHPALAAGIATVLAILLHGKATLHGLVRNALSRQELSDALMLAVAALVIWPLLPDRYMGPFDAWNPRTLWLVAMLVMLMGAAGHIATRLFGERVGLPVTGLFGGFVSSAATIGSMAVMVRRTPGLRDAAVAAALLSSVATFVQMLLLLAATSAAALRPLALPLAAGLTAMGLYAGVWLWLAARRPAVRDGAQDGAQLAGRSLDWRVAAGFVLLMALLLLVNGATRASSGAGMLMVVAVAGGFADAHAATVSVAAQVAAGRMPAEAAVWPVLAAFSANTATKIVLAAAGGRAFALRVGAGLVLAGAVTWAAALALAWLR